MDRTQIEARLPHAGAMVLLDRLISWSADRIECRSRSHCEAQNPLRTPRGLSVLAGIEYAGQTIALHTSLTSKVAFEGGVLAALRNVRWEPADMSSWADDLVIRARLLGRSANAANYEFSLSRDERTILTGTALVAFKHMKAIRA